MKLMRSAVTTTTPKLMCTLNPRIATLTHQQEVDRSRALLRPVGVIFIMTNLQTSFPPISSRVGQYRYWLLLHNMICREAKVMMPIRVYIWRRRLICVGSDLHGAVIDCWGTWIIANVTLPAVIRKTLRHGYCWEMMILILILSRLQNVQRICQCFITVRNPPLLFLQLGFNIDQLVIRYLQVCGFALIELPGSGKLTQIAPSLRRIRIDRVNPTHLVVG